VLVGVVLAGLAWAGVAVPVGATSEQPTLPTASGFYDSPVPASTLASIPPGTVLRQRTVDVPWLGSSSLEVRATQLLYRTTTELGAPTVTVTTVLQDPLARLAPVRIVSWQMFYDALGAECDPSYTLRGGNPGYGDAQEEEALMTPYLLAGDTLVVSDYEGEDLAWGAGQQSGYQTLDGIRAAEAALGVPERTTPVAMVGYSGGSIATDWAAELAPAYAPGLDLVGAAMGGVPVDYAHNLAYINGSPDWSGVIPAILVGVARAFGVPLAPYLSSYGAKVIAQVQDGCINSFVGNYPGLTIQSLLKPQYQDFLQVPVFASIVNELIMGTDGTPRLPILLANGNSDGTGDGVMVAADVEALAHRDCAAGLPVTFLEERGLDHTEAAVPFELAAFPTIEGWLAGLPPVNGCGAVGTGNALTPLPAGTVPPAPPVGSVRSADLTTVAERGQGQVVAEGLRRGVAATLEGTGALTLADFAPDRDPVGPTDFPSTGQFFSVALASGSQASAVDLVACGPGRPSGLRWWDPAAAGGRGAWEVVSGAAIGVRPPAGLPGQGCLSVRLGPGSSPSLSALTAEGASTGTVFGVVGTTPSPVPAGGPSVRGTARGDLAVALGGLGLALHLGLGLQRS
jgi:hypothetical protein